MKKSLLLLLALCLVLTLCACGEPAAPAPAPEVPVAPDVESAPETPVEEAPPVEDIPAEELPVEILPAEVETPEEEAPAEEVPAEDPAEPAEPTAFELARGFIDGPLAELIAAIGEPVDTYYEYSCSGPGDDGILYYEGFTVYTYREPDQSAETVLEVEESEE